MNKILIIHPDSNAANNPNLFSVLELFNNYYSIDLVQMKKSDIYQELFLGNVNIIFYYDSNQDAILNEDLIGYLTQQKYSLIIGVDLGIIPASIISMGNKTPYGLISYEIAFKDEIGEKDKYKEISACENLNFAICQDPLRSYLLSRENKIPLEKILNIPVASCYNGPYNKNNYLRVKFNIPNNKKIALYIGSMDTWTMIDVLINQVTNWPDDWVLVLHPRYGENQSLLKYYQKIVKLGLSKKIFFSKEPFPDINDLEKIICSADLGIALYQNQLESKYIGKNIVFLGMSSGKIFSYMKYGLPVLVNNIINISDEITRNRLGFVALEHNQINPEFIDVSELNNYSNNCLRFYLEKIDFNIYKKSLLEVVKKVVEKDCPLSLIQACNDANTNHFNEYSYVKMIEKLLNNENQEIDNLKRSYSYRIGRVITAPVKAVLKRLKHLFF